MTKIRNWFKGCKEKNGGNIATEKQQDYRSMLAQNLEKFKQYGDEGKRLAEVFLIKQQITEEYLSSLGKDEKLGEDVAKYLINNHRIDLLVRYLEKFEGLNLNYSEMADELIEYNEGDIVLENIEKLKGMTYEDLLIKVANGRRDWKLVEKILERGKWFTKKTIDILLYRDKPRLIVEYLGKFEGITHNEIFDMLIKKRGGWAIIDNLDKFHWLTHQEIANKLIMGGWGREVVENLEKFEGLNHSEIVNKLIENGQGREVACNIEKFKGVNYLEISNKLIEAGCGEYLLKNLNEFKGEGTTKKEIIQRMIVRGESEKIVWASDYYEGLDEEIVNSLIESDNLVDLLRCLNHLNCSLSGEISDQIVEKVDSLRRIDAVIQNIEKFEKLNIKMAEILIERGYHDIVLQNANKFLLKK